MAQDTRAKIIMAADQVVRDKGAAKLTLDEVARAASVSKGGLLYHFATKEQLLQAMLEDALTAFEIELERRRGGDTSPGSWLRAYIKASFPTESTTLHQQSMVGSALLASIGNDPGQAGPYRSHLQRWVQCAAEDGINPAVAQTVRLAIDALWLHEALGLHPYATAQRAQLLDAMLAFTREPAPVANPSRRKRA